MISIIYEKLKFKKKTIGGYDKISVKRNVKKLEEKYQELVDKEIASYEEKIDKKNEEIEKYLNKNKN